MKLFLCYLSEQKHRITSYLCFCLILFISFLLYRLPLKAVIYPVLLCSVLGSIFFLESFFRMLNKHRKLSSLFGLPAELIEELPAFPCITDADYHQLICELCEKQKHLTEHMDSKYSNMADYYTAWAHQIKTPISSMRLHLQNEDSALSRVLSMDLGRIEQYVEMVLMFVRLDSETTDYVFRSCDLDTLIKQSIKRFSGEFILKKLSLTYESLHVSIVTDEKWLSFVIEQVLSNALKYTQTGGIAICLEQPLVLCIKDTGIGIAKEDLPRIFEKGYTGYNGRTYRRASGIGLYLCKRICTNLGHSISADSAPGAGTTIRINLEQKKIETE